MCVLQIVTYAVVEKGIENKEEQTYKHKCSASSGTYTVLHNSLLGMLSKICSWKRSIVIHHDRTTHPVFD